MRVLVVAHGFPPHAQGGSEIYAYHHARALRERCGDDVFVLTREQDPSRPEYDARVEERDGLQVAWINNTFRSTTSFEDSYRNPAIARVAARFIDEWQPAVAHVHHLTCLSTEIVDVLATRRVPIVYTLHDYWLLCHRGQRLDTSYQVCDGPGPAGCGACVHPGADAAVPASMVPALRAAEGRLPKAIGAAGRQIVAAVLQAGASAADSASAVRTRHMRQVLERIDRFLAPSHAMRDWFIGQGVPAARIGFSPYGLDDAPLRRVVRQRSSTLRVGFVGTLMISKGPDVLLRAFERLPPGRASLELFGAPADYHGDTAYRTTLEPLLSLPGVTVSGPRPHTQIPDALASIDVLVAPSIWPENSPFVIQEALLSGIPVVGSRTGGIPELIDDGRNGLLFEAGDVDGLHHALTRLLSEPGLLDALSDGARGTTFRTLDEDVHAARTLYQDLRSAAGSRAPAGSRRIAAVVVNHRTPEDTCLAARSLVASRRPLDHIVVVDNDVPDQLRSRAAEWGQTVTYLHTGANLGFAGGVNAGVRAALAAGADAVLLVNSDAVVAPSCLSHLERALEPPSGAAIAAPLILARTDPATVASAGIDYDTRTGRMRERHAGRPRAAVDVTSGVRVAASGCVLLVTREAWERVGLLDERYFFGFEDIDLCLRAGAAGLRTRFEPTALAYHEGGGSLGPASPRRFYFAARNHLLLARDHHAGGFVASLARPFVVVALNVAHALTSPGGSRAAKLGATLRGTLDYARGRFGRPTTND